jgi:hypothetical protein
MQDIKYYLIVFLCDLMFRLLEVGREDKICRTERGEMPLKANKIMPTING